mmetsp:Transcript_12242/g.16903  ORF Transcript_12242/g.16903 Transcript_12242/m.16903 type:complete len:221 (-) Transcript_12242:614-1276(-)
MDLTYQSENSSKVITSRSPSLYMTVIASFTSSSVTVGSTRSRRERIFSFVIVPDLSVSKDSNIGFTRERIRSSDWMYQCLKSSSLIFPSLSLSNSTKILSNSSSDALSPKSNRANNIFNSSLSISPFPSTSTSLNTLSTFPAICATSPIPAFSSREKCSGSRMSLSTPARKVPDQATMEDALDPPLMSDLAEGVALLLRLGLEAVSGSFSILSSAFPFVL